MSEHNELIKQISEYVGSIQIHVDNYRTLSITFETTQATMNKVQSLLDSKSVMVSSLFYQRIGNRGEGVFYRYTMVLVF